MLKWDTSWRALRDAAGLHGLRFHDLRHTIITELAEMGVADHVLESISGHLSRRMADTSGRAPGSGSEGGHLRDGRREGRVKDVACADARCAWRKPRGCARAANDRV
jgi:integrase